MFSNLTVGYIFVLEFPLCFSRSQILQDTFWELMERFLAAICRQLLSLRDFTRRRSEPAREPKKKKPGTMAGLPR
jgi:hypothetical protein